PRERLSADVSERGEKVDALLVELTCRSRVTAEEGKVPEGDEHGRKRARSPDGTCLLSGGGEAHPGGLEVALLSCEDPGHVESVRAQLGGRVVRERERRFQALPALRQVSVDLPETAHADHEAQCRPGVLDLE